MNIIIIIHPSIVPWVHHQLVSTAHLTIVSMACASVLSSFSECIFPRYTIPLRRQAIPFLVVLFLFSLPSPRTPPPSAVCYLPFYKCTCTQITFCRLHYGLQNVIPRHRNHSSTFTYAVYNMCALFETDYPRYEYGVK